MPPMHSLQELRTLPNELLVPPLCYFLIIGMHRVTLNSTAFPQPIPENLCVDKQVSKDSGTKM